MALDVIYCLCGQSSDLSRFMIQCDICKDWFHGRCVGVREYQAVDIDRFHCPRCEPYHGPSVLKARLNWHRHDYSEADAANKAVQTGTQVFIKELRGRHFHSAEKIITRLQGSELNLSYIAGDDAGGREKGGGGGGGEESTTTTGFTQPILVEDKTGLDLVIPDLPFSVMDVETYVGPDHEVDVIDVQRQTDVKMRLHEFIEYFLSPARTTVLNLISLEFSGTSLSQMVEPPSIVRKLCWVNSSWPTDPPTAPPLSRPNVSKYCLIGVENSYTDFHIDFGGTSVWYHVLWGEKVFYLIKPTPANLVLYQRWMKASNHSEMFFGDQVDACYKCEVKAGQTMFIPTGWIHAVLTPTDTLVFGGNFLHSYCIDLQIKIYELEQSMSTPDKFRFPHYQELCWFAVRHLLQELRASVAPPAALLHGARALYATLRHWLHQGGRSVSTGARVPEGVSAGKLLKELQRELRSTEKQAVALNPPRPERESKRRKKKHLADDFVDYTNLTSFHTALEERLPKKEKEGYDSDFQDDKKSQEVKVKQDPEQQQSSLDQQQLSLEQQQLQHKFPPDPQQQQLQEQQLQQITTTDIRTEQPQQQQLELQQMQQEQEVPNHQQQQPPPASELKLGLPRQTTGYQYSLFGGTDYGMSGTPPHDPDYQQYQQQQYPTNVKSEFEWSESPGVTPYRLARTTAVVNSSTAAVSTTSVTIRGDTVVNNTSSNNNNNGVVVVSTTNGAADAVLDSAAALYQQQYDDSAQQQQQLDDMSSPCEEEDEQDGGGLMIDESPVSRRHSRTAAGAATVIRRAVDGAVPIPHQQLKLKLAFSPTGVVETTEMSVGSEVVYGGSSVEVAGEVEVAQSSQHHNGIEELLRASAYTPGDYNNVQYVSQQQTYRTMEELDGSGRASPSTRDAIAGMLSMSRDVADTASPTYTNVHGNSNAPASGKRHQLVSSARSSAMQQHGASSTSATPLYHHKQRTHPTVATVLNKPSSRRYLEDDCIKKVHQDEDYVYPTLDHSDEDDFPIFKPRGKKKEDEAWNPKARVRVWGPKPERPARVGVKKQSVEKGLEMAASRRNTLPVAKRAYHRKKGRGGASTAAAGGGATGPAAAPHSTMSNNTAISGASSNLLHHHHPLHPHHHSNSTTSLSSGPSSSNSSSSVSSSSSSGGVVGSTSSSSSSSHHHHHVTHHHHHRPKKGMATAKQRLGKILKIHKMIY